MELSLLVLIEVAFIYAGSLPALFFKNGAEKNLKWFLSCVPFFVLPFLLLVQFFLELPTSVPVIGLLNSAYTILAVVCAVLSVLLINWSVLTHKTAIPLWHQEGHQLPSELVTSGPYQFLRHPFYSAYLLLFLASVFAWFHWSTLILFIWGVVAISITAKQEESTLLSTDLAEQYGKYRKNAGFLLPKFTNA